MIRHTQPIMTTGLCACFLLTTTVQLSGCAASKENPGIASVAAGVAAGGVSAALCKLAGGSDAQCAAIAIGAALAAGAVTYIALNKLADRDEAARAHRYEETKGTVGYIDSVYVDPNPDAPGRKAVLKSRWSVLAANQNEDVPWSDDWEVQYEGKPDVRKYEGKKGESAQGTYESGIQITVPGDWPLGNYTVRHNLHVADKTDTQTAQFSLVKPETLGATERTDVVVVAVNAQ